MFFLKNYLASIEQNDVGDKQILFSNNLNTILKNIYHKVRQMSSQKYNTKTSKGIRAYLP